MTRTEALIVHRFLLEHLEYPGDIVTSKRVGDNHIEKVLKLEIHSLEDVKKIFGVDLTARLAKELL